MTEAVITVPQAADRLGIHVETYKRNRSMLPPIFKVCGLNRVRSADVDSYIESRGEKRSRDD